jgi:hypothetical protein
VFADEFDPRPGAAGGGGIAATGVGYVVENGAGAGGGGGGGGVFPRLNRSDWHLHAMMIKITAITVRDSIAFMFFPYWLVNATDFRKAAQKNLIRSKILAIAEKGNYSLSDL